MDISQILKGVHNIFTPTSTHNYSPNHHLRLDNTKKATRGAFGNKVLNSNNSRGQYRFLNNLKRQKG